MAMGPVTRSTRRAERHAEGRRATTPTSHRQRDHRREFRRRHGRRHSSVSLTLRRTSKPRLLARRPMAPATTPPTRSPHGFANLLDGGALGNDTLDGGDGDDSLTGGRAATARWRRGGRFARAGRTATSVRQHRERHARRRHRNDMLDGGGTRTRLRRRGRRPLLGGSGTIRSKAARTRTRFRAARATTLYPGRSTPFRTTAAPTPCAQGSPATCWAPTWRTYAHHGAAAAPELPQQHVAGDGAANLLNGVSRRGHAHAAAGSTRWRASGWRHAPGKRCGHHRATRIVSCRTP